MPYIAPVFLSFKPVLSVLLHVRGSAYFVVGAGLGVVEVVVLVVGHGVPHVTGHLARILPPYSAERNDVTSELRTSA